MTVLSSADRASDYYHFNELLTPEEQAARKRVREFMEKEVAPIMTDTFHIIPKLGASIPNLGALRVVGGSIKGYGCPGLSITANAIATAEISRVDASCGTFNLEKYEDYLKLKSRVEILQYSQRHLLGEPTVEFLGTGEVVRIETTNGWCLPVDSLPSHVPKDVCTVKKPHNG
ncbi:hypothetical protein IGI04_013885 [Brassica rapa subsp. trilocularis]|uniref:Acyl-CoA dehydrogenase/oxidase N-terminal domain-containing protein n=1 Tax=Brassica rapa subsp. trilocularis TaxID=1813537 RepID=A0ABQ7NC91_BRACM|nr:hypothetical protein IGI04_013885 [Brassica rapa subsp. trilocularis]